MRFHEATALLLSLLLAAPSMPVVADCGCSAPSTGSATATSDSRCESAETGSCCAEMEISHGLSCCRERLAGEPEAVGCCGKPTSTCSCGDSSPCQCGSTCHCGEASEQPAEKPVTPPSESESTTLITQPPPTFLALACDAAGSCRLAPLDARLAADCLTSSERCAQLCRFLR